MNENIIYLFRFD